MPLHRPPRGGARVRAGAVSRALVLPALAATFAAFTVSAPAPVAASTILAPPVPALALAASALPPMGVPYAQLLAAAPQLAGGARAASAIAPAPAAGARPPLGAQAGSIAQVRTGKLVQVHRGPGGPVVETLDWRSDSGAQPRAFTVYAVAGSAWLGVSVPSLGGHLGWIAADPARVLVRPALQEIRVSLAQRRLWLLRAGRVVLSTAVVIGAADTPTPPGQFSVDDIRRFAPASPEYGIGALALSVPPPGHDWVYWRVAIHGTNNLGRLGGTGSLGCVHVPAALLARLLRVPVGTPVDITA